MKTKSVEGDPKTKTCNSKTWYYCNPTTRSKYKGVCRIHKLSECKGMASSSDYHKMMKKGRTIQTRQLLTLRRK